MINFLFIALAVVVFGSLIGEYRGKEYDEKIMVLAG